MFTCALISLRTGTPQDIAAVVALGNTEILMCNEVMSFGGQLLEAKSIEINIDFHENHCVITSWS